MTMDKHTTWLAYIWALISGICAQWTLNDYGALIGIVLGIGTFLVNKHYKKKSEQAQARQAAAMEERNRLIARILEKNDHDSMLKMLAVSEMPEGNDGAKDTSLIRSFRRYAGTDCRRCQRTAATRPVFTGAGRKYAGGRS